MTENRQNWVIWASLLVAIVGVILAGLSLLRQSQTIALISFLVLGLTAVIAGVVSYVSSKKLDDMSKTLEEPPITICEIRKVISFEDGDSTKSSHTDYRKVRVNHTTEPTFYWFKNLAPVDSIANIYIDGAEPDKTVEEAHSLRVGKHYSHGFDRGQEFDVELKLDWYGAFPDGDKEFHRHIVLDKTERLRLCINFHPDRPYSNPRVLSGPGPGSYREATDTTLTEHANQIEVEVSNPEVCKQYYIEWEW